MNNTEIKVSVKDIPEVIEQLEKAEKILLDKEKLEKENKQLKEEKPYLYTNTEWEDILEYQGKSYIELDRFKTIQQENKKLKEQKKQAIENIKTIKQHYEELKKAPFEDSVFINDMLRQSFILSIESYLDLFLEILGDKE